MTQSGNIHMHWPGDGRCLGPQVQGYLHHKGRLLKGAAAGTIFDVRGFDDFTRVVGECLGQFSVVVEKDGEIWAAVDRTRSMPLFYACDRQRLLISDDAYWVRSQAGDNTPGDVESAELWYMLYVLGPNTLAPSVKQLCPGTAIRVFHQGGDLSVEIRQYYRYLQNPPLEGDQESLLARLEEVMEDAFVRMLDSTRGRQIVIPLSGGLDSRLVACMLKRLGAPRVLAFSYGKRDNDEARVSREMAGRLGYRWQFVSFKDMNWRDVKLQSHLKQFTRFSSQLSVLPPALEDWLAIGELTRRGVLEEDAVFCPGHTAGFTSGRRALDSAAQTHDEHELADLILQKHSPRLHWQQPDQATLDGMKAHVLDTLHGAARCGKWDPMAMLESWNWYERQSKRIIHMARSYEYWGYQWRIPLWDGALMDFWGRLPTKHRQDKALYRTFLKRNSERLFFGLYSGDSLSPAARRGGWTSLPARAWKRQAIGRYYSADKGLERLLSGSLIGYLRRVGRRTFSSEPVTAPWLLLEGLGVQGIWQADAVGQGGLNERTKVPCPAL